MPYELVDASGDVALRATAKTPGATLVELGRGLAHVLTEGSEIASKKRRPFNFNEGSGDLPALAVAYVNELLFLFETEGFLVAGGQLELKSTKLGHIVEGTLKGDAFDPNGHGHGTEVKAATFHDASFEKTTKGFRAYLMLDL